MQECFYEYAISGRVSGLRPWARSLCASSGRLAGRETCGERTSA